MIFTLTPSYQKFLHMSFQLYDLMIMAVKHQVLLSQNPRHLIMVTLNHLDAITDYATTPNTKKNIHTTYELLIQVQSFIVHYYFLKNLQKFDKNSLLSKSY